MGIEKKRDTDFLIFFVNGRKIVEETPDPSTTLLQYLRNKLRLTGSKLGCGEGGCGACTVMVSRYNSKTDSITHYSANACLAPICSLHGFAITTVEGIGSTKTRLHPIQERLAKAHGSQCGFCTPGIVMSMYALLRNNPHPTREQIEDNFDGNLCRCTGYRPILQGFYSFAKGGCPMGEACCQNQKLSNGTAFQNGTAECISNGDVDEDGDDGIVSYDHSQEPIFPPELKLKHQQYQTPLCYKSDNITWYRPMTLDELYRLKAEHPNAKIIIGNTEVGIEVKFKKMAYPVLIDGAHVPELATIETTDTGLQFGSSVTLAKFEDTLQKAVKELPEAQSQVFAAIRDMLKLYAGHQIRNVASIGGNIMTASPISDLNPLFMAAGATLTVGSKDKGTRQILMDEHFFTGYRQTAVLPNEILLSIHIPFTRKNEFFSGYKQAHRKEDDISIVNAGMRVIFKEATDVVEDISLVYGGMAPTTVMARKTMEALIGSAWNDDLVNKACQNLAADLPLTPGAPGGMTEYRQTLTTSFFYKFFLNVLRRLISEGRSTTGRISPTLDSACVSISRDVSEGIQVFEEVPADQSADDDCGRPLVHSSALQQTTGEAVYVDDMPKHEDELYGELLLSTKAHARIVSVNASDVLRMPGVVDYVNHRDVPNNKWGAIVPDEEEVFATEKVQAQGQTIGLVVAETQAQAQAAVDKIKVVYEEMKPIITIQEAEAANSFFEREYNVSNGDVAAGFTKSDHVLEGECNIGSQEHFYLETQAALARPSREENVFEIHTNSQFASDIQHKVAAMLGVQANRVISKVKRIGGGFGGKQSRTLAVALPVAAAAHKLGRPVRCMLDRQDDMVSTGTRHAFKGRYKIGFTSEGKIIAFDIKLFANGGWSVDLSGEVLIKAVSAADNAYRIPNLRVTGKICKTNIPSATAFRGFGAPQGMFMIECAIDNVANFLQIPPEKVRQMNLYREGDLTHYNQQVIDSHLPRLWANCLHQSDFHQKRKVVDQFNRDNRWKKRGLCVMPTKFGLSYESPSTFLNQSAALVTLYMDGSVMVSHCGSEMGQGLNIKMIQVASRALGIPASEVFINDTATDKIPLTSPTAASSGSDLNGGAIQNACEILKRRLLPYMKADPGGSWKDWVNNLDFFSRTATINRSIGLVGQAYLDCVPLSASGSFYVKELDYDPQVNKGRFFNYFTCGVACSEVEVDCLTGDHQVLRTDIVMDVGKSLNPSIDIGQIEGAFVQGYGLFCLEQQKISPSGVVLTRGPGAYKIPGFKNIPVKLNVTLLKESTNTRAVYSSKGIGEPPLFLASSVFFAIKDAIRSARQDAGCTEGFPFDSPATPERIRLACEDKFTKQFPSAAKGTYTPWFVDL